MIEENIKTILGELAAGNSRGEPVVLVAATKTRTPDEINRAIAAGVRDVGENKAQELRDKAGLLRGERRLHFIGHLQCNKVKYVVGRCELIHSVDRDELAAELARQAERMGAVQKVLLQVNIGNEENKGGYPLPEAEEAYLRLAEKESLQPCGLMAMLPQSDDEGLLSALTEEMRALLDKLAKRDKGAKILSMGMSGDWRLCIAHGSNMVRIGSAIFGERHLAN